MGIAINIDIDIGTDVDIDNLSARVQQLRGT